MAYGTLDGVSSRLPALRIGTASAPGSADVLIWLDEGAAWIDRALSSAGYVVPVGTTATLYAELAALNEQYAAAYALRSRGLDSTTGLTEERSSVWLTEIERRLSNLAKGDLTAMGATLAAVTETSLRSRRRMRSVQMRRIDGYSGQHELGSQEWSGVVPPSD